MKSSQRIRAILAPGLLTSVLSANALGQVATLPNAAYDNKIRLVGDLLNNSVLVPRVGNSLTIPNPLPPQNLGSFDIVINAGPILAANQPALDAFNRAANAWKARISDPITVTINADLIVGLPAGVIGSTSSIILGGGYGSVRDAMALDASFEPDDHIVSSLPTVAQFTARVPGPVTTPGHGQDFLSGEVWGSKANFKALGIPDLDTMFGVSDADIGFSNSFAFDFDNSDGVGAGLVDFQTVAAHEIGHALGFFSIVDEIIAEGPASGFIPFSTLDFFRFEDGGQFDPADSNDFSTKPRNLVPGFPAITDEIFTATPERMMSTGVITPTYPLADGNQASHWKADEQTGSLIGLMDPTLGNGVAYDPQEPDFRALDLIGYDIVTSVPEPTGVVAAVGLLGLLAKRVLRKA